METNVKDSLVPAVVYARYSCHAQNDQSIDGQLRDAHAYAERNGYRIIHEYCDRALSGKTDNRPEFLQMIQDAKKHTFSAVLVWKIDRFARNRYDSARYKVQLKKEGVRVVSVMEGIASGAEGIIMEGLLESMAEYYSANLSENVRRGLRESAAKGYFVGSKVPFGFRAENRRLVEDPETAPILREIFCRYADGEGKKAIADDLNARGYRTSSGGRFTVDAFKHLLSNTAYFGQYTFAGTIVDGCADALIDRDLFDRAQERTAQHRRAPASGKAPVRYLLTGKLYCGVCGATMVGSCSYGGGGKLYRYYMCMGKIRHTCTKQTERKDVLEEYVCSETVKWVLAPDKQDLIADLIMDELAKDKNTDEIAALERTVRRIDGELNKLVDALIEMPISARPKIAQKMEALQSQLADAEQDLSAKRAAAAVTVKRDTVIAWLQSFRLADGDEGMRQQMIDTFINSIYLYDDRIIVFYNLPGMYQSLDAVGPDKRLDMELSGWPDVSKSKHAYIFVRGLLGLVLWR